MRKLAILLAAALLVSAPLVAFTMTDTYAAAKKGKKGKKVSAKAAEPTPEQQNMRFHRALSDLANSLHTYVYVPGDDGKGKKAGKKSGGGKKGGKK